MMNWFTGPIQEAIAAAKQNQKIFLVFVEGKDETSRNMASTIVESNISEPINENCVAIKLVTDSEPFRQFSQIYPVIVVPSMFFIGDNGIPLEVIAGSENGEELSSKIRKAIQLHKSKLLERSASTSAATATASPSISSAGASATSDLRQSLPESIPEEPIEGESNGNNLGGEEDEEAMARRMLRQKLERAEQLMAERRMLKEREEKEAEKQKELEHRRVGREMQRAKEQNKDKEMADWAKQRQKEKLEEKAARDRVLAQIAQDKADRAAKSQFTGGASPPTASASPQQQAIPEPEVRHRSPTEGACNSNVTRIQFRLPNSATVTSEFPSDASLNDVITHVNQVIKPGFSGFSLATTFPRRHFARCDFPRSLRELELCPSAVLLILPVSAVNPVNSGSGSGFWSLLWTLLSPLTMSWQFISSLLFGSGSRNAPPPTAGTSRQSPAPPSSQPGSNPATSSSNTSHYRRDGNVHRLANESSNDDEDGTWNGNSTQQM